LLLVEAVVEEETMAAVDRDQLLVVVAA